MMENNNVGNKIKIAISYIVIILLFILIFFCNNCKPKTTNPNIPNKITTGTNIKNKLIVSKTSNENKEKNKQKQNNNEIKKNKTISNNINNNVNIILEKIENSPIEQEKKLKKICEITDKLIIIEGKCLNKQLDKQIKNRIKDILTNKITKSNNIKYDNFIIKYDDKDRLLQIVVHPKSKRIIPLNRLYYFVDKKNNKLLPRLNIIRLLNDWELLLFNGNSLKKYFAYLKLKTFNKNEISDVKLNNTIVSKFLRAYKFYFGKTDDFKLQLISNLFYTNLDNNWAVSCGTYIENYDNKLFGNKYNICILWKRIDKVQYKFDDLIQF